MENAPCWHTPQLSGTMGGGAPSCLLVWVCLFLWYGWQLVLALAVPQSENSPPSLSVIGPHLSWNTMALLCLIPSSPWQRHMILHGQDIESFVCMSLVCGHASHTPVNVCLFSCFEFPNGLSCVVAVNGTEACLIISGLYDNTPRVVIHKAGAGFRELVRT